MLKMAVFAPIPSASVRTTVSENEGFATSARQANFRFRAIPSIDVSTLSETTPPGLDGGKAKSV